MAKRMGRSMAMAMAMLWALGLGVGSDPTEQQETRETCERIHASVLNESFFHSLVVGSRPAVIVGMQEAHEAEALQSWPALQARDWDLRTLESFFHGEVVEVAVAVKPENEPAVFENAELTSAWPGATELWQSLLEEEQLPSEILGRTCDRFTVECRIERYMKGTLAFIPCHSEPDDGTAPCTRFIVDHVLGRPATVRTRIEHLSRGSLQSSFDVPVGAYLEYGSLPLAMALALGGGIPRPDPMDHTTEETSSEEPRPEAPPPPFARHLPIEKNRIWLSSAPAPAPDLEALSEAAVTKDGNGKGNEKGNESSRKDQTITATRLTGATGCTREERGEGGESDSRASGRGSSRASTAAQLHYDDSENLSFQVFGSREWRLYPPSLGPDLRQGYMLEGKHSPLSTVCLLTC